MMQTVSKLFFWIADWLHKLTKTLEGEEVIWRRSKRRIYWARKVDALWWFFFGWGRVIERTSIRSILNKLKQQ